MPGGFIRKDFPVLQNRTHDVLGTKWRAGLPVRDIHSRIAIAEQHARQVIQAQCGGCAQAVIAIHDDAAGAVDRERCGPDAGAGNRASQIPDRVWIDFFRCVEEGARLERDAIGLRIDRGVCLAGAIVEARVQADRLAELLPLRASATRTHRLPGGTAGRLQTTRRIGGAIGRVLTSAL